MIKTYYKSGNSATEYYGLHIHPNAHAIGNSVKEFEETKIERYVHHSITRSAENFTIVSESIVEDPNVSIPHVIIRN